MYRLVIFICGLAVAVVGQHKGGPPPCVRISHGGLACCKNEIPEMASPKEDFKECFKAMKKPPNCDVEICVAKKKGLASDDGTIDKKKMIEAVENEFESDPALVDSIKENCINGDLSKYGPPDFCDLMKQRHCFEVQMVKACKQWKDDGECSGMKDLAAECVKNFT